MERNLTFRKTVQPSLANPNAGSVFKNPENDSAGRLLDKAGVKEFEAPNVKIWEKHANFIVNKGDATSEDVLEMMVKMHNAVKDTYTIELRPEIIFIGEKGSILRITQIVKMYSVHIITAYDFPYQFHQILFRSRMPWVEEIFTFVRDTDIFHPLGDGLTSERSNMFLIPQRNSYHPGVTFHSPFMTFLNGESQWIIAGVSSCLSS